MMRHKKVLTSISIAAVVAVAVALLTFHYSQGSARAGTVPAVTSAITIDPQNGEVFAPPPSDPAPAMTPTDAYVAYEKKQGVSVTSIPGNVKVQIGLLTLPVGTAGSDTSGLTVKDGVAYTALNELVYGYSWQSCPQVVPVPGASASAPANPCIEWNFLDANTGLQIDQTWQMTS